jgi:hypothetical protein
VCDKVNGYSGSTNCLCTTLLSFTLSHHSLTRSSPLLLCAALQVHTSVRSAAKAEFLKSLAGASERLTIFSGVDLLESGSYRECISGCDAVLHTASPFFFEGGSEELLVTPALEGWIVVDTATDF